MKLSEKFAIAAVVSVLFKFVLAGLTIAYGTNSLTIGPVDAATIAAILAPCLGAVHLETYVNKKGGTKDDPQV